MLAVLMFFVWFQMKGFVAGYPEPDPDGYLIMAKRLAHAEPLAIPEPDPFLYYEHFWVDAADGTGVVPKFAPGYSAVLSLFYRMGGDRGMFWATPTMGLILLIGLFTLARQWMSWVAAVMTCAALSACWMFEFYATYPLAHILQMTLIVWGMVFLWRWIDGPRVMTAVAAGLTLGAACSVRHTSAAMALVMLVAIVGVCWRWRATITWRSRLLSVGALLVAYSVVPLVTAWFNWTYYGSPLTTGYALSNEQGAMSLVNLPGNLPTLWMGLRDQLAIFILPLGLVGLIAIGPWYSRLMRLVWVGVIVLMYGSYYYAPAHGGYYRFFLPIAPVLYACAFLLIDRAKASWWARVPAMAVVVAGVAMTNWGQLSQPAPADPHSWYQKSRSIEMAAEVAATTLSPDAAIFAWPGNNYYTGTRKSFRVYNLQSFSKRWGLEKFAPPTPRTPRTQESRRLRLLGIYEKNEDEALREMRDDIMRRAISEKRQVAWMFPDSREERLRRTLAETFTLKLLVQWTQPDGENWGLYEIAGK